MKFLNAVKTKNCVNSKRRFVTLALTNQLAHLLTRFDGPLRFPCGNGQKCGTVVSSEYSITSIFVNAFMKINASGAFLL